MYYFATFFDKNYLSRGVVLYNSIKKYTSDFKFYILCLDSETKDYFSKQNSLQYSEVFCIELSELELYNRDFLACKGNRSKVEYYFTLSPCLPLYLLETYNIPSVCTLDADILFMDSPAIIFKYLNKFSVVITPHKFSREAKHLEKYGFYNVSFQIFKNDSIGINCLKKWQLDCINWCFDKLDLENGRFADQKYLDKWEILYPGAIKVLDDNVCGLAPWNLNNYKISKKSGVYYSNMERIIFYHFHHFKIISNRFSTNGFNDYKTKNQPFIKEIYNNYWKLLNDVNPINSNIDSKSIRYIAAENLITRLIFESTAFFRLNNKMLLFINLEKIPIIIKKIILNLYGRNN
jgi:hypothetical protein